MNRYILTKLFLLLIAATLVGCQKSKSETAAEVDPDLMPKVNEVAVSKETPTDVDLEASTTGSTQPATPETDSSESFEEKRVSIRYPDKINSFGIRLWQMDNILIVSGIGRQSSAEKSGLKEGAILLAVNGISVEKKGLRFALRKIREAEGAATLTVLQEDREQSFELKRSSHETTHLRFYYEIDVLPDDLTEMFASENSQTVASYIVQGKIRAAETMLDRAEFQQSDVDPQHSVLKLWIMCRKYDLCSFCTFRLEKEFDEQSPYQKILEQLNLCIELDSANRSLVANVVGHSCLHWVQKYCDAGKILIKSNASVRSSKRIASDSIYGGPFVSLLIKSCEVDYTMWRRWAHSFQAVTGKFEANGDFCSAALLRTNHHYRCVGFNKTVLAAVARDFVHKLKSASSSQVNKIAQAYVLSMRGNFKESGLATLVKNSAVHREVIKLIKKSDKELGLSVERHVGIYTKAHFQSVDRLISLHVRSYFDGNTALFLSTFDPVSRKRAAKELKDYQIDTREVNLQTRAGTYRTLNGIAHKPIEKVLFCHLLDERTRKKVLQVDGRWVLCIPHDELRKLDFAEQMFVGPFNTSTHVGSRNVARYFDPAKHGLSSNRYFIAAIIKKNKDGTFAIEDSGFIDLLSRCNMRNAR